ncbi:MAG: YkgJ family cysteine cluster protein [Deltaproteobacteria bacterium]|nr:YkgJ family cysteine cluster protein [Deltaproteobacteria bacterium]
MLTATLMARKDRRQCIRCGECCLRSGPSLQLRDIPLVMEGPIAPAHLYALRVGELVWDNVHQQWQKTGTEIIKVKEQKGTRACLFYDAAKKACTIYEHRPVQCVAMKCWDPSEFMRVYQEPKASRKDIIFDPNLLRLMAVHEAQCGYDRLEHFVKAIENTGEEAVKEVLGILKWDHDLRRMAPENLGLPHDALDLVFGRPLTHTISMFGLKAVRKPDGSYLLTTLSSP